MLLTLRTRLAPDLGHGMSVANKKTRIAASTEAVQNVGSPKTADSVKDRLLVYCWAESVKCLRS